MAYTAPWSYLISAPATGVNQQLKSAAGDVPTRVAIRNFDTTNAILVSWDGGRNYTTQVLQGEEITIDASPLALDVKGVGGTVTVGIVCRGGWPEVVQRTS